MMRRLRSAGLAALLLLVCGAGVTAVAVLQVLAGEHPVVAAIAVAALIAGRAAVSGVRDRRAARRIAAWEAATGWTPASPDRTWPWQPLLERPGRTTVHRCWTATVGGLAVTAGEISWDDNVLAGAVAGWKGRGVCVVVRLPAPVEAMAVRRGGRTVGDSPRLALPAMREAFAAGRIPAWTARDDEFFTFEAVEGRLAPEAVERAVERALLAIRLLGLRSPVR